LLVPGFDMFYFYTCTGVCIKIKHKNVQLPHIEPTLCRSADHAEDRC
jgi:hypothetical protein